jgi:RimJ/RimL family protein N-acetyltransferase
MSGGISPVNRMRIYLTTERLILREFTEEDLESLIALNNDPEVMRYLTGGVPLCAERIRQEMLPAFLRFHVESPNFGCWAAMETATGDFIGWFQFHPKQDPEVGIELGYRLKRASWGKGYATEGSRALIARGFKELGVRRVFARAMASNTASIRVMEKSGLHFHRAYQEPEFPTGQQLAVIYALTNPLLAEARRDDTGGTHVMDPVQAALLNSFTYNLHYARRLLADIADEAMCRQPLPGMNHPAWIIGHLCDTCDLMADWLQVPRNCPADWGVLFDNQSEPRPERSLYPSKAILLDVFEKVHATIVTAFQQAPADVLNRPLPRETMKRLFPTVRDGVAFEMTDHAAIHLGQLSAWRRAMGMPRA